MADEHPLKQGAGRTGKSAIGRGGPENVPSGQPLDSVDVPPMVRADFRLPADLKARAQAEAERQGLDFSEYARQCIAAQLAWVSALQAVQAAENMDALASTNWLLKRLGEMTGD